MTNEHETERAFAACQGVNLDDDGEEDMTDNCNHIHGACDPGAPGGEHVFTCTLPKGHDGNHVDLTWGHMTDSGPVADDYCIWEWSDDREVGWESDAR